VSSTPTPKPRGGCDAPARGHRRRSGAGPGRPADHQGRLAPVRRPPPRPARPGHRRGPAGHARQGPGRARRGPRDLPRRPAAGAHPDHPPGPGHRPADGRAQPAPGLRPPRRHPQRCLRHRQDHRANPAGPHPRTRRPAPLPRRPASAAGRLRHRPPGRNRPDARRGVRPLLRPGAVQPRQHHRRRQRRLRHRGRHQCRPGVCG